MTAKTYLHSLSKKISKRQDVRQTTKNATQNKRQKVICFQCANFFKIILVAKSNPITKYCHISSYDLFEVRL